MYTRSTPEWYWKQQKPLKMWKLNFGGGRVVLTVRVGPFASLKGHQEGIYCNLQHHKNKCTGIAHKAILFQIRKLPLIFTNDIIALIIVHIAALVNV